MIDDKLKEILTRCRKMETTEDVQVAQIKQAFIDSGWVSAEDMSETDVYLSGKAWYDRFEKELVNQWSKKHPLTWTDKQVLEAAKKASGLE